MPSRIFKYELEFSEERHDKNAENLYNSAINLANAIDVLKLDDSILLKANIKKNEFENKKHTLILDYSFYAFAGENTDLMEDLKYGQG